MERNLNCILFNVLKNMCSKSNTRHYLVLLANNQYLCQAMPKISSPKPKKNIISMYIS